MELFAQQYLVLDSNQQALSLPSVHLPFPSAAFRAVGSEYADGSLAGACYSAKNLSQPCGLSVLITECLHTTGASFTMTAAAGRSVITGLNRN